MRNIGSRLLLDVMEPDYYQLERETMRLRVRAFCLFVLSATYLLIHGVNAEAAVLPTLSEVLHTNGLYEIGYEGQGGASRNYFRRCG